ncbi:MAG: hypothetical protein AAF235_01420 [Planctomycetota bacterium]
MRWFATLCIAVTLLAALTGCGKRDAVVWTDIELDHIRLDASAKDTATFLRAMAAERGYRLLGESARQSKTNGSINFMHHVISVRRRDGVVYDYVLSTDSDHACTVSIAPQDAALAASTETEVDEALEEFAAFMTANDSSWISSDLKQRYTSERHDVSDR